MSTRRERSRTTRLLIDLAWERFSACGVCWADEAGEFIEDVLRPLRLKRRESKRLLERLTCPHCDARVSAGTFVVKNGPDELLQGRLRRKFDATYGERVQDLRKFLIDFPMLGADHPFGKVLSKAMKRAQRTPLPAAIWHRATTNPAEPNFSPRPALESIRANRYNQIGQAAWYLASDEKTAAVETIRRPIAGVSIGIAKVELNETITVLDLRSAIWGTGPLRQWILRNVVDGRFISEPAAADEDGRPEYRVPQFIADLARRNKFRGILYDSTRPSPHNNPDAVGYNVVVFDPPAYTIAAERAVRFVAPDLADPDYDPFDEVWRLRTQEFAVAMKEFREAASRETALTDTQRQDLFEVLTFITQQGGKPREQRLKKSIVRAAAQWIPTAIASASNLAELWERLSPTIKRFFGI